MDSIFNTRYLYLTDLIETTLDPTDVFVFTKHTPLDEVKYVNAVITVADMIIALGGGRSVTSFSSGNLAPLFTTSVATASSTPALTFTLTTQNANTVFAGPSAGFPAVPTFRALTAADLPVIPTPTLAQVLVAGNVTGGTDIVINLTDRIASADNVIQQNFGINGITPFWYLTTDPGALGTTGYLYADGFISVLAFNNDYVEVSPGLIRFNAPIYRFSQLTASTAVYINGLEELVSIPFTSNGDVFTLVGGIPAWSVPVGTTLTSCIANLYVTNINSCSDLNILPTTADNIILVAGGGVVGIGGFNVSVQFQIQTSKAFGLQIINSGVAAQNYGAEFKAIGVGVDNIGAVFGATGATNNYAILVAAGEGSVGIGTITPHSSALLDIASTTQGVAFPRMSSAQKNAITATNGLVVYDQDLDKLCVFTTVWETITSV